MTVIQPSKFALVVVVTFLTACQIQTSPTKSRSSSNEHAVVHLTPSSKIVKLKNLGNELPVKTVSSHLSPASVKLCVKSHILHGLGIPPRFIEEKQTPNHAYVILLKNPYSNSEGVYFRVKQQPNHLTTLDLYRNHLPYISKRWYSFMKACQ